MRALMIVVAGVTLMFGSAIVAGVEMEKSAQEKAPKIVVASTHTSGPVKHVKKAHKAAATEAPARVWSLEMSCCEPQ
jgi:hypothetical protein